MLASDKQREALVSIFHKGTKLHYKKGDLIIHPGETPVGVFYIEKGLVKAYNISKYGEENLLILRRALEIFPLIWVFTGQERSIIYQAVEDTDVWRIDRKTFLNHATKELDTLLPTFDMTMEMYHIHSERIINLEYRTVRERLISFLVMMARRFGHKNSDGTISINVSLKQQDIASSINSSRETTSRELMRLERLGQVKNDSGKLKIIKMAELKAAL